ncbi:hypothetical protein HKCCE3408_05495 [Rhodobacterales bacterium HKCCE3408]|nr:hypothetical protein [Rhodobacterales bacterium HKCCE3408]
MKSLAAAAGFAILATTAAPAFAGGMAPQTPAPVVIADTQTSDGGILVPILALIFFAATMSN